MRLAEIKPETYARAVLPLTAPLWAGRRSFEEYAAQTLEMARSPYGRRHYRTMGLYDNGTIVASYKRYERMLHHRERRIRGIGFGAVFTPIEYRGRGYASIMLAAALDQARKNGSEIAFLFSDIRPQFYSALGFTALPSRQFSLRADTLPSMRLDLAYVTDDAWMAVRRVFERWENRRDAGFLRDAAVWNWIAMRARHGSEYRSGRATNLLLRRRGRIAAYVLGVRAPEADAYGIDEFAFADETAGAMIPALLRAAAGDLRRVWGWRPPDGAGRLLPKPSVRARKSAVLMMAPLAAAGTALLQHVAESGRDFCWATDHI
ncbi:MAG: GNAT family N-acetyltransferase [Candidatus Eremiobacteraeota bacterium]|nr:GNAT family N-acetyltransferase [Candidatus Eremiobacteraeota bacterium]